jgi:protein-S-isoprenylcysteine O-methyltransferase Ste14
MHLFDQRILGILILLLLGILVTVKRAATGSILDAPKGNALVHTVNVFNLFFLLIVNLAAGVLLIARLFPSADPTHVALDAPPLVSAMEFFGLAIYASGFLLMAWALRTLGRNYQLGGIAPRTGDTLVSQGPYRLVRHPMYTSALCIAFGLACLLQSWACFGVFCIYVILILLLIPAEERVVQQAYGDGYAAYRRTTKRLLPFVY